MAGPLGCADSYQVSIMDRGGDRQIGELVDVSALDYGRVIDDTSTARVTVPFQGPDCCKLLSEINDWCNSLAVWRNGTTLVWQGPITYIDYGRDDTVIDASDVTAWLFKRRIRELVDFTATGEGAADLVVIAETLVRHGFEPDDPHVLDYLMTVASGIVGERQYKANSAYVGDALAELARTGIDYVAIGRRLILAGEIPIATLPGLTDDDFLGEVRVIKDGRAAVTDATVVGKGTVGRAQVDGACGLLEVLANEEEILDQASADAEARSLVAGGYPTPLIVNVPDGSQLDPRAPVGINDLIPGVLVPVTSVQTCRKVAANLRLQRLSVSYGDAGEAVRVTLVPPGTVNQ